MAKADPAKRITAEQFAGIFAALTAGEPLRQVLKEFNVDARRFYRTIDADAALAQRYTRAKFDGLDRLADDTLRIADDPDLDPNDKRIRVDTRKWLLSKLAPKVYGDRVNVEHGVTADFAGILADARKRTAK